MFVPQLLEQLLPPRQKEDIPTGENVEEVMLSDYEPQTRGHGGGGGRGQAYEEDDDEDEMGGAPRMQCAQQ